LALFREAIGGPLFPEVLGAICIGTTSSGVDLLAFPRSEGWDAFLVHYESGERFSMGNDIASWLLRFYRKEPVAGVPEVREIVWPEGADIPFFSPLPQGSPETTQEQIWPRAQLEDFL
jgi:hypothetical protein